MFTSSVNPVVAIAADNHRLAAQQFHSNFPIRISQFAEVTNYMNFI